MDPRIAEFVAQARSYCALIEDLSYPNDSPEFARQCLLQLLQLSHLAMQLPDLEDDRGASPDDPIDPDTWRSTEASISKRLPADYYWQVYDPLPLEQEGLEPCVGSLADDLADTWQDLKPGLLALDSHSTTLAAIVHSWKWRFEHHWGKHAVDATTALYTICYGFEDQLGRDTNDIRRISSSQRRPRS